jgi:chromosome segregation ATPase
MTDNRLIERWQRYITIKKRSLPDCEVEFLEEAAKALQEAQTDAARIAAKVEDLSARNAMLLERFSDKCTENDELRDELADAIRERDEARNDLKGALDLANSFEDERDEARKALGKAERTIEFVALQSWREDPPNANAPFTEAERFSVIKFHPGIKGIWDRARSTFNDSKEGEG